LECAQTDTQKRKQYIHQFHSVHLADIIKSLCDNVLTTVVQGSGGGAFDIDRSSGLITQTRRLDREQTSSFEFTVTAGNDGYPGTTSSVAVFVNVEDQNDNSPIVHFPTTADRLLVQLGRDTTIGTLITRIDASDPDAGLSLSPLNSLLRE